MNKERSALLAQWDALVPGAGPRQCRLFDCAVCRRSPDALADERVRVVLEVAERFADGRASEAELDAARATLREVSRNSQAASILDELWETVAPDESLQYRFAESVGNWEQSATWGLELWREFRSRLAILKDLAGHSLWTGTFDPAWRTPTVLVIARRIYDDRDFAALPILADALAEAGCDDAAFLDHCRCPELHVRGCWPVDLILATRVERV
jgi:hypothetical protein